MKRVMYAGLFALLGACTSPNTSEQRPFSFTNPSRYDVITADSQHYVLLWEEGKIAIHTKTHLTTKGLRRLTGDSYRLIDTVMTDQRNYLNAEFKDRYTVRFAQKETMFTLDEHIQRLEGLGCEVMPIPEKYNTERYDFSSVLRVID